MSTLNNVDFREASAREPSWPTAPVRPSVSVRLKVAIRRDALDQALAQGADADARPELALRATQLQRLRHRRTLARTLRRVVAEACGPRPPVRATAVIIARSQIRAQRDELLVLAERLESPQPTRPTGVAVVQQLITDAIRSPLYVESDPRTLHDLARHAGAHMDATVEPLGGRRGPASADAEGGLQRL